MGRCSGLAGTLPLPAEGQSLRLSSPGPGRLISGADNDLSGKFPLSGLPIVFLAPGPGLGLFLLQTLKEQINSSKLWQMGVLWVVN